MPTGILAGPVRKDMRQIERPDLLQLVQAQNEIIALLEEVSKKIQELCETQEEKESSLDGMC